MTVNGHTLSRITLWCLALLAPWPGFAAPAAKVETAPFDAAVRELGRTWLVDYAGVGLSIGIYENGKRHFYNFGTVQIDGDRIPTKDTVYEIGTLTKVFSGQLLARAVVEGRASLNDEATKYLDEPYPNFENTGEKIRVVHLANMTSQLLDLIPDVSQVRNVPGEPLTVTRMKVFERYTRTEFLRQLRFLAPRLPPGEELSPSNVAAMLLGVVLEKMYGDDFETLLAREIEKPLRMASGTQPDLKRLARGYDADNQPLPPFSPPILLSSGALRYSADDLLKFAAWQMVERDASVKLAHKATWNTKDMKEGVGLFWLIGQSPAGRRLQFSGGTYGFASFCDLYPDARVAVVLLSNKAADGALASLRALSAKLVRVVAPPGPAAPPGDVSPQPSSAGAPQPGH
jgi:CubicO group peptidase (beta-lactamase class C family)